MPPRATGREEGVEPREYDSCLRGSAQDGEAWPRGTECGLRRDGAHRPHGTPSAARPPPAPPEEATGMRAHVCMARRAPAHARPPHPACARHRAQT